MENNDKLRVVAADVTKEGLLVHFVNHTSILFQADFLYGCREKGGYLLPTEDDEGIPGR